jgi:transcription elongation GreA/GreB family factor
MQMKTSSTSFPIDQFHCIRNLVTVEGLAAIEATFARLQQEYARALASGNRAGLAATSRELRYWGSRRASAQVVATPVNPSKVQFGCSVTIFAG